MDKRIQFYKLKSLIESLQNETYSLDELQSVIAMNIASSPKIIENAIRTMGMTGLIKDIGSSRFQIIKNGTV